jgi:hypothetical protein
MNETVARYIEALDRTNNSEYMFTPEEKEEFDAFFKEHPELEKMRQELLEQKVPEFKQNIANYYLSDIAKYKDIESILGDIGINLDGVKDVTLSNGKRILVFYTSDSLEPTTIEFDPNKNVLEELRKKQLDYKQYQGLDAGFNAEEILKDLAKEENLYINVQFIDKYEPSPEVLQDKEKLTMIQQLLKKASEKNAILSGDDRFQYINEQNCFIMTKNGKVLEAKKDEMTNEIVVDSPKEEKEFKDETVTASSPEAYEQSVLNGTNEEIKDEDYSFDSPEEEKEETNKYKQAYDIVFTEKGKELSEEEKEEFIENLKKIDEGEMTIFEVDPDLRDAYQEALDVVQLEIENEELEISNSYTLTYKPKRETNKEEGASAYWYIALVVLLIAFAIFMYIVLKR